MQAGVFEQKVGGLDAYSKRRLHSKIGAAPLFNTELVLPNLLEWQLPKDSRGRVLAAAEKTGVDDEAHNTCRDINRCYKFTGSR